MVDVKIDNAKQYTTVAAPFDSHDDAPVQCHVHCPMEGVRGFTRSPWTPSLGEYLLGIIPADNGVACKKKTTKRAPYLLAILMAVVVRWYDTARIAQQRGSRAIVEATG
jgi:hypothetical protein